jgi:hypothetical protein
MVIRDFDVMGIPVVPGEAYPVSIVNAHTVLSGPLAGKGLEGVSGRAEVMQALCRVKLKKSANCNFLDGLKPPRSDSVEDFLGFGISERPDH